MNSAVIIVSRKLKRPTTLEWGSMEKHSYQFSWKSVKFFKRLDG